MSTTLYTVDPVTHFFAAGFEIVQAGTVVPDGVVWAIQTAAAGAGVTLNTSAGGAPQLVQVPSYYNGGTGSPVGDSLPVGAEVKDSTGAVFEKTPGGWIAAGAQPGTFVVGDFSGATDRQVAVWEAATNKLKPRAPSSRFNVKDYGAVGNATTDDLTAITAAITACVSAGGGEVYFPAPGQYAVSTSIAVPSGVKLVGPSPGFFSVTNMRAVLVPTAAAADVPTVTNADRTNGNNGIGLRGLRIKGKTGNTSAAVDFSGSSTATCRSLYVRDCLIDGQNAANGLKLTYVQETYVEQNYFFGSTGPALLLANSYDNTIAGNQITVTSPAQTGGHGINLTALSGSNIIRGNFVFLCDEGILVQSGASNVITANRVNTNLRNGIALRPFSAGETVQGCVVVGNQCYDNGTAASGTRAGICLDQKAAGATVVGNDCWDDRAGGSRTQLNGIRIASTSTGNTVIGNAGRQHLGADFSDDSSGTNRVTANSWGPGPTFNVVGKTASYTLTKADGQVTLNGVGLTATLPAPATVVGQVFSINAGSVNAVTLATPSGNVQNAATQTIAGNTAVRVVSDGTNYWYC